MNVFVVERQAQARWKSGGLVDAKGLVFDAKTQKPVPEFSGPKYMMPKVVAFQTAITPMLKQQQMSIKQIDVSERGAWTLVLNNGVVLKLGRRDLQERLQRFLTYWHRDLAPLGNNLVYVDLRYHDGFAIRQNAVAAAKAKEQQSSEQMPTALPETE